MDKKCDICIETPQDYNTLTDKQKGEFNDALFLLNGNILRDFFSNKKTIKAICGDKPDIRVEFTESDVKRIIGLEIVKCYPFQNMNSTRMKNDLCSICENVINELKTKNKLDFSHKVICVGVSHGIMVNGFDEAEKNAIIRELKTNIINALLKKGHSDSTYSCKYILKLDIKENMFIPENKEYRIEVSSTMAYIIPAVKEFAKSSEDDPITNCISRKREKLKEYKQRDCNSDISEWWLGISIPDDAYFHIRGYQLPDCVNIETEHDKNPVYDRIFLISKTPYNPNVYQVFPSMGSI